MATSSISSRPSAYTVYLIGRTTRIQNETLFSLLLLLEPDSESDEMKAFISTFGHIIRVHTSRGPAQSKDSGRVSSSWSIHFVRLGKIEHDLDTNFSHQKCLTLLKSPGMDASLADDCAFVGIRPADKYVSPVAIYFKWDILLKFDKFWTTFRN